MGDIRRDQLDVLLERALRDRVCGETPPSRVWTNIKVGVQERREHAPSRFQHVRGLWTDVVSYGADVVFGARITLTPSPAGGENGWTQRLVLGGPSSAPLHYSIHH
jgi:hypothetical protein